MAELNTQILIRNDSARNWESKNPVLGVGEFGVEVGATDNKLKIGDGQTPWNDLAYTYDLAELQKIATFANDLTMTMQFGKFVPDATGSVTVPAAGMTAEQVLLNAFAEAKDPEVKDPSLTLTTSGNKSGEVGTQFALPYATASVGTGSYQYGSQDASGNKYTDTNTGITFTSIKVSCQEPAANQSASNTNSSVKLSLTTTELPDSTRIFEDEERTINFSAEATHPASARTPVNNLGTKVDSLAITGPKTLTKTASVKMTGYRAWFTYIGTDCTTAVASAFIRNGENRGDSGSAASLTGTDNKGIEIPVGTKRILVAIPVGGKQLTDVIDVDGMGLSAFANFNKSVVSVEGANGYAGTDYNVWVAENANGLAATHYNFIIG